MYLHVNQIATSGGNNEYPAKGFGCGEKNGECGPVGKSGGPARGTGYGVGNSVLLLGKLDFNRLHSSDHIS